MAAQRIIAFPVAVLRSDGITNDLKLEGEDPLNKRNLLVQAYYVVRAKLYRSGVTGAHSSVDYGFEDVVGDFYEFCQKVGHSYTHVPFLMNIVRPYSESLDGSGEEYFDPGFSKRWDEIYKLGYGLYQEIPQAGGTIAKFK